MARGEDIVELARKSLGVKYVWGGNDLSSGIDCSGLVQQVFKAYGISLPRVTYDQINVGFSVQPNKLRPGDLVFFDTDRKRTGPDHVGIYMGGGKFIHAPRPGEGVKISSLAEGYYMDRWMGGRRVPGVSADHASGGGEAPEVAPRLDAHELAETYGASYAFFKSQPELWKLLNGAVQAQWTPEKFQAEVKNSSWWKKTSDTVRQAQMLEKTDPATYQATMEAARVQARQIAVRAGAIMSEKNISNLARNMVYYAWNEQQVMNYVGQYIKFGENNVLGGIAGQAAREIKREAYSLGVQVGDQSVLNNAQYLVRGITTMEKIQASLREQAAGLYPAFAEQIQAGANMQELAEPYRQILAQELQLPDTDVDLFSPKIKAALNYVGQDGRPRAMSLAEFTSMIRDDPQWRRTAGAADKAIGIGRQVLAQMGLVG
ncbi:C40 family peptidase [Streptomyces coeruleoprunus]|uniref:C40 family peptidase n=1 Tax=Streptomyces coeruleoprunus TaxID=285563 RepID=A0ABV9XLN6_9ACTN